MPNKIPLYLAGPMSGILHCNYHAFMEAKKTIEEIICLSDKPEWRVECVYDVKTPFDAGNTVWQRHYTRDFDPYTDKQDYGSLHLAEIWAEDIKILCASQVMVILPGWEKSRGTTVEILTALNILNIPILEYPTLKRKYFELMPESLDFYGQFHDSY